MVKEHRSGRSPRFRARAKQACAGAFVGLAFQAFSACAVTHVPYADGGWEPDEADECESDARACDAGVMGTDGGMRLDAGATDTRREAGASDAARDGRIDAAGSPGDAGSGNPGPGTVQGTLISVLGSDESAFVTASHPLELLSAQTGQPFSPTLVGTTAQGSGKFALRSPEPEVWVHVIGIGPAASPTSTYDSLHLWAPRSGDSLVRIAQVGTASVAEVTGAFTADSAGAPVEGAVYRVDSTGKRVGTVGCAKIFLDALPSPATAHAQRYIRGVLPTTLEQQDRTQRSGRWFFGNVSPGRHTFRVSVDDGKTFVAEKTTFIPLARSQAAGAFKAVMVRIGIDVPGADPTPASCPQDF